MDITEIGTIERLYCPPLKQEKKNLSKLGKMKIRSQVYEGKEMRRKNQSAERFSKESKRGKLLKSAIIIKSLKHNITNELSLNEETFVKWDESRVLNKVADSTMKQRIIIREESLKVELILKAMQADKY
ncbi:MAG: hypothetical protein KDK96_08480 [Chlamydiia bacterium]|nr:hypothetical protein [Chlamydiia bacterium]